MSTYTNLTSGDDIFECPDLMVDRINSFSAEVIAASKGAERAVLSSDVITILLLGDALTWGNKNDPYYGVSTFVGRLTNGVPSFIQI